MKSAFGSKRKARKIQVDEEDDGGANNTTASSDPASSGTITSNTVRKPFKKSHLRQSIAFDDQESNDAGSQPINKPSLGRSSSLIKKKKPAASRLSFGPGEIISGDAAEALEDDEAFTPKKATLGRRVVEGNAIRKSLPYQGGREEDEERPTYSKDYLKELKSSTPTTPKDLLAHYASVEEEGLGEEELDGAMVVDLEGEKAFIPSEAEIREKKERRARLAHEQDFISLDSGPDDRRQISLLPRKKKEESRLVREDENVMEGFEEFVDDGRVSLGKKQEREERRRKKREMAEMILRAEGGSEESDDSEKERREEYEAAQTRKGMDGLHKPAKEHESLASQVPAKITPLPDLEECLGRLQSTLSAMELGLAKRRRKIEEAQQEKVEILRDEVRVQDLLKQAGNRFAALRPETDGATPDPQSMAQGNGFMGPLVVDRGLESFGNTPTIRSEIEDIG